MNDYLHVEPVSFAPYDENEYRLLADDGSESGVDLRMTQASAIELYQMLDTTIGAYLREGRALAREHEAARVPASVREEQALAAIRASGKPWYCYRHSKPYEDPDAGCELCQADELLEAADLSRKARKENL